jgi:magnesium transporter
MIRIYRRNQNYIEKTNTLRDEGNLSDLIWIDLQYPLREEIDEVEKRFDVDIPSKVQQEEIESSSRFADVKDYILINSNFLRYISDIEFETVHVSFIIKGDLIITYREGQLKSFTDCMEKIMATPKHFSNGKQIFTALLETRVDFDADMIEILSRHIALIGKELTKTGGTREEVLKQISGFQETAMVIRENIIDKQRVITSILRSPDFVDIEKDRFRIILRDIDSLIDHTNFLFERLEYLQNTFLGLVNIDQNKIIKIFTVVSVVFMPPTLIASVYGMNYKFMPELNWWLGYPFALILMIVSSTATLWIFKKRNWL